MPRRSLDAAAVIVPDEVPAEAAQDRVTDWISSGSTLGDLVLGGGWSTGKIINIVGDRSSGKTLLAIEAIVNFVNMGNDPHHVRYVDAESVFDASYAAVLGLPSGIQTTADGNGIGGMETIEEFFADIDKFMDGVPEGQSSLYILDSLDSLSDSAEMERDYDQGTYGAQKAKNLSQFFRRTVTKLARRSCTLVIISQLRDKLNVTYGEKQTRSGGRALDFYAAQIVWLAEKGKLKKTALSMERVIGIETRFRTKKNKVGKPFREADLTIIFDYGIDDEVSMIEWLKEAKIMTAAMAKDEVTKISALRKARDFDGATAVRSELAEIVTERWQEIEDKLAPPMGKYSA